MQTRVRRNASDVLHLSRHSSGCKDDNFDYGTLQILITKAVLAILSTSRGDQSYTDTDTGPRLDLLGSFLLQVSIVSIITISVQDMGRTNLLLGLLQLPFGLFPLLLSFLLCFLLLLLVSGYSCQYVRLGGEGRSKGDLTASRRPQSVPCGL
jgi:hypothetical protein